MRKSLIYKIITITAVLLAVAAVIFLLQRFSGKEKSKITLENNSGEDDILAGENFEKINAPPSSGPEKSEEKSEVETKKESTPATPPEKTNNNSAAKPEITDKLISSGFQAASGRTIDTIIIHSSYDALGSDPFDVDGLIKEYESYGVSAHYLINRVGIIYRLVEEKNIAYHAGTSRLPDGRTNVNEVSIGIELMNTKKGDFTGKQYGALQSLIDYLKGKYEIKYVLGHDQIAPGRKDDPWNFDWKKIK
jgi:hypothetical protein